MPALAAMEPHLDADTLAAYVDGRLAVAELGRADRHIDGCASCRVELSALAAVHTQPVLPDVATPEGAIGRYRILRELGRGSMGIVLRAYDPELARPVALKLLRDLDDSTRELLRREARALAKLRHPNVVTIYDVIVDGDAIYVAMELVDGDTLRAFCKGKPVREILAACIAAGRGLAAAHDADVIHRDFKPENVLCTPAGEVRVSDFGLARTAEESPADGVWAGTPAYMAPEVLRREPATAASDQYSYCVSVYELVEGARPTGDPAPTVMPAWLWRVVKRGLSRDPAQRYPSMHALVAALSDDPAVRRRRRAWLGGGAVAAVAAGALAMRLVPTGASCALDDGTPWDAARKQQVTAGLTKATDADVAAHVVASLDDVGARWTLARSQACAKRNALAMTCLERSRRELGELTEVLAGADASIAGRAQDAISRLRDPAACSAADEVLPADPARIAIGQQARMLLDRATMLQYFGKSDDAERLVHPLVGELADQPRLLAEALLVEGRIDNERARGARAEDTLYRALHEAERGRADALVAAIWVEIVMATGAQDHRFDLAMSNARAADAALARIVPGSELQVRYEYTVGTMLLAHGKLDDARQRLLAGLHDAGDDPRRRAQVGLFEMALCDVERQANKPALAHPHCDRGIALLEDTLGKDHVRVAVSLSIVGSLAFGESDLAGAERAYRRAIDIFEKRDARDHIAYALAESNLGAVYASRTDIEHAQAQFEKALALFEKYHPGHPQTQFALQGLAGIALRRGDFAHAVEYFTRVRDSMAAAYTPDSQQVMVAEYNLALAYRGAKRDAEAQPLIDHLIEKTLVPGKESWMLAARALDHAATLSEDRGDWKGSVAFRERAIGALEHGGAKIERAIARRNLGMTLIRTKDFARALPYAEQALALASEANGDAYEMGRARWCVALALEGVRRDHPRAISLAKQAQADFASAQAGESLAFYRAMTARFLADAAKHP